MNKSRELKSNSFIIKLTKMCFCNTTSYFYRRSSFIDDPICCCRRESSRTVRFIKVEVEEPPRFRCVPQIEQITTFDVVRRQRLIEWDELRPRVEFRKRYVLETLC